MVGRCDIAFFSNGTEGEIFNQNFCSRCVHEGDCPILDLHWLHNYEQFIEHAKTDIEKAVAQRTRDFLSTLIEDVWSDKGKWWDCKMFVDKRDAPPKFRTHLDRELVPLEVGE